jgi:signal transduction histidine kinase
MNSLTRSRALRTAAAVVALAATWGILFAGSSLLGAGLGVIGTLALVVTAFADELMPGSRSPESNLPALVAPEGVPPVNLGDAATVLSLLGDPVIAYDGLFRIVFANDAATQLFGLTREELAKFVITPQLAQTDPRYTRLVQVVYPSLAPVVIPRSNQDGRLQVVDLAFTEPELNLRVSTTELPDHKGFLKVIRDRTRTLAILRSKGEFVTVASHQLRTPLTEVSWALETLAASTTIGPDDKALVDQTLESVRTLTRTAEDLLGVAKIEEGRFGYRFEAIDITQVLDAELAKALPIVEAAGIKLFFERPSIVLSPVIADREKIVMVINNLIENGLRYNVKNGEILVKAEPAEDPAFVKVSVRDTGIGIAQADVEKLFTKFFRAENAVKAVASGTGLGLYIASNIIRAHGGQMGVASELGRGTTFSFTLATDARRVPQREVGAEI